MKYLVLWLKLDIIRDGEPGIGGGGGLDSGFGVAKFLLPHVVCGEESSFVDECLPTIGQ